MRQIQIPKINRKDSVATPEHIMQNGRNYTLYSSFDIPTSDHEKKARSGDSYSVHKLAKITNTANFYNEMAKRGFGLITPNETSSPSEATLYLDNSVPTEAFSTVSERVLASLPTSQFTGLEKHPEELIVQPNVLSSIVQSALGVAA